MEKIKQLIKHSLLLTNNEFDVIEAIEKIDKPIAVMEIAQSFNCTRTTIQKAMMRLSELGYVKKRQVNQPRGFRFEYLISTHYKETKRKKIEEIKNEIEKYLENDKK